MKTLFSIEKSFAGNIVSMVRPLTEDDVNFTATESKEVTDHNSATAFASSGFAITLKQEHIDDLIKVCNIGVSNEGRYTSSNNGMSGLTHSWDSKRPEYYFAQVKKYIEYRGTRKKDKAKKFNIVLSEVKEQFASEKQALVDKALSEITEDIEHAINYNNFKVTDGIRRVVVDANIKDYENYFNEDEKVQHDNLVKEKDETREQINALRQKEHEINQTIYSVKRQALTRAALNGLGEKGRAIVNSLENESLEINQSVELFL